MQIHFKYIISLLSLSLLWSCQQNMSEINIIEVEKVESVVGGSDALYQFGVSRSSDVFNKDELSSKGLILYFDEDEILRSAEIKSDNYQTENGIQIGDHKSKVRAQVGKPNNEKITLRKGDVVIGNFEAMIYDDLIFFMDKGRVETIVYHYKEQR